MKKLNMIRWIKNNIKFFLLKKKFPNSKIHFNASIDKNSQLGRHSVVFSNVILTDTIIDDYSYIQTNSVLISVEVGRFCSIAANVHIGLAIHPTNMVSTHPIFYGYEEGILPRFFTKKTCRIILYFQR